MAEPRNDLTPGRLAAFEREVFSVEAKLARWRFDWKIEIAGETPRFLKRLRRCGVVSEKNITVLIRYLSFHVRQMSR